MPGNGMMQNLLSAEHTPQDKHRIQGKEAFSLKAHCRCHIPSSGFQGSRRAQLIQA